MSDIMVKILFAIYLIVLSIDSIAAYEKECAGGPEYWCKSFENAQDCGALRHCTDTAWSNDDKYALVDASTTCQWCERIFEKIDQSLGNNEDMIVSTLTSGCQLLQSDDLSTKCKNVIENYETSVIQLMKNKRFTTLCHLMNICTNEKASMIVGSNRCTWGPSYWCSSLSNSRECGSTDHCSNRIWSQQSIQKQENDNICQYCEYVIDKLRSSITENKTVIDVNKWLSGACKMLKVKTEIDECVQKMSQYGEEILVLLKNQIDSGIICHLGQMCKDATIIPREKPNEDQSKVLCNVIVRATHDLHVNEKKTQYEIEIFLKNDCEKLSTIDLKQKCKNLIEQYGNDIYEHVVNNMELSKICEKTALQPISHVHCDLCTFIMTNTKVMLDAKQTEDQVFGYIDEQLCSRLDGDMKQNCKFMIQTNGNDLINQINQGKQPMLICTYFQVCFNEIIDKSSPIKKNEMRLFIKENICDNLGMLKDSCYALIEKDVNHLLKILINDFDGEISCQIFGICPRQISLLDDLSINDDKNKCKRCIDDFTRRQHIAEKLVNHSSEFLHHLCGQLPNKDECIKSIDESINKLVQFIQSLNPQDICVELKMCNQTLLESIPKTSLNHAISEEVMKFIKVEICENIGPLSNWCNHLMDSEGAGLFKLLSRDTDPHQVCSIIDICPTTTAFENCNDKCECCVSKVNDYQERLAQLLNALSRTVESVCEYMPNTKECPPIATEFKSIIDGIVYSFNAKQICQTFSHCSASISAKCDNDKCQCCKDNINFRQGNFREIINETIPILLSFCKDDACRSNIHSKYGEIINQISTSIDTLTICQNFGFCSPENTRRPILSSLMSKTYSSVDSVMKDLANNLCSNFENLEPICEHLISSLENIRYKHVYMAFLENNTSLIDQDFREQSTDTCDGCKNAVESGKTFWINSLETVRNALLQTCAYCPSKEQCQNYFNQQFDQLKSYINQINAEQFCQNIHLCLIPILSIDTCGTCIQRFDIRKDGFLQAIDRLAGYFNDLCQKYAEKQCQIYVKHIKDSLQESIQDFNSNDVCTTIGFCGTDGITNELSFDQYEKSIEDEIEINICSTLGPFEILCKDIIHGNIEDIQSLQMNYDIEDIMKIGNEFIEDPSESNDKDKCKCCIARVSRRIRHIKFIGDIFYDTAIHSCKRCPAKHECRRHLKIAKARFDKRIDNICPFQVCQHLGICNKTNETEIIQQSIQDSTNSTCILCEYVMNILSNYIHQQSTEEEIEQNLEKICDQVPSVLQNQCREYIENYSPTIISILLREFNLSTVCQKLNLCTNQMKVDITHISKADTVTCGICDYISTYIHFSLQRNSNEKSLQHALSIVCTHLSDENHLKCQTIIQLFTPNIRQLELNPEKNFCKQLTICQIPMIDLTPGISTETIDQSLIPETSKLTPKCTICQYIISYLDAVLKNNKSEQAVEEALAKVCTILPEKQRSECDQLIKTYGPVIAQLIAQSADPDTICRYLGVCQKSTVIIEQTPYTCNICQYMISRMKSFFDHNQNENELLISLKESCNLFSIDNLKKQCQNFVNNYGLHFSPIISNDIEPKIACQGIGICTDHHKESTTTAAVPVEPVTRYGKCIFGMNYWCTSRENAKLCNAVELCELHVWSKKNPILT